jgi:acyl carrier protein
VPRRVLKVVLSIESGAKSRNAQQPAEQRPAAALHKEVTSRKPVIQQQSKVTAVELPSKASQALSILADESGLSESELTDSMVFADAGIDSLMGLTITARFKEELDLELEFNSLFFEYPTVGELKALLGASAERKDSLVMFEASDTDNESSDSQSKVSSTGSPSLAGTGTTTPQSVATVSFSKVLAVVSEESGVAIGDLTDDTNFNDAGIDSLMSLVVVSRLRDELELDIQHESLFLDCPTVADLRRSLCDKSVTFEDCEPSLGAFPGFGDRKKSLMSDCETNVILSNSGKSDDDLRQLADRKRAIDEYVGKYIAGFQAPTADREALMPQVNRKVVLVTGTSGSLGGHLAYHLAQQRESTGTIYSTNKSYAGQRHTLLGRLEV